MKILIVEDDSIMLMVLKRILQNFGYNVITAEDGKEGIEMIKLELPDMVITDFILPKISGSDIVFYLKHFPVKKIPVILLSAMPKGGVNNNDDYGADAYLVKPVAPQILIHTIEKFSYSRMHRREWAVA